MKTTQFILPGVAFSLSTMLVMTMGCRIFNYTDEEMAAFQRELDGGPSERCAPGWTPSSPKVNPGKLVPRNDPVNVRTSVRTH